eukprot:Pgem_evm2s19369
MVKKLKRSQNDLENQGNGSEIVSNKKLKKSSIKKSNKNKKKNLNNNNTNNNNNNSNDNSDTVASFGTTTENGTSLPSTSANIANMSNYNTNNTNFNYNINTMTSVRAKPDQKWDTEFQKRYGWLVFFVALGALAAINVGCAIYVCTISDTNTIMAYQ